MRHRRGRSMHSSLITAASYFAPPRAPRRTQQKIASTSAYVDSHSFALCLTCSRFGPHQGAAITVLVPRPAVGGGALFPFVIAPRVAEGCVSAGPVSVGRASFSDPRAPPSLFDPSLPIVPWRLAAKSREERDRVRAECAADPPHEHRVALTVRHDSGSPRFATRAPRWVHLGRPPAWPGRRSLLERRLRVPRCRCHY